MCENLNTHTAYAAPPFLSRLPKILLCLKVWNDTFWNKLCRMKHSVTISGFQFDGLVLEKVTPLRYQWSNVILALIYRLNLRHLKCFCDCDNWVLVWSITAQAEFWTYSSNAIYLIYPNANCDKPIVPHAMVIKADWPCGKFNFL